MAQGQDDSTSCILSFLCESRSGVSLVYPLSVCKYKGLIAVLEEYDNVRASYSEPSPPQITIPWVPPPVFIKNLCIGQHTGDPVHLSTIAIAEILLHFFSLIGCRMGLSIHPLRKQLP